MLKKIIETKKKEIEILELPNQVEVTNYSLYKALKNKNRSVGLIAEVKKASPSKGVIREHFDPVQIAKEYEKGGADAISVLTDVSYFQGSSDYLSAIKKVVNIPVMRKDFIIDKKQVDETVLIGADAMLLIVDTVPIKQLKDLYDYAYEKKLECLVEVHSKQELEELLNEFTPKMIGINNRNLKTFETSLQQTVEMSRMIPEQSLFVSESGIFTKADIDLVQRAGASAVLVGESLMREENTNEGILTLFGGESIGSFS
ncbi:indole-3-glycerol phosphate synthase TrpC [Alkalihalobacillus trypoxylicola]|uniref:Indole-3-glycerol phosphate synthase n=1 Tax=Alkalihalobacillus trypoxylicola TaxID=519424 RepID=A0A161PI18_9BACI|nr:indole-3-glycerol phosphate synthase TrpC [Alkalihalobacillus trypoxylicola]KYG32865.1 indole-3-glycerol phosphate synthase [Alkalihalobacillus trypoxylicola]